MSGFFLTQHVKQWPFKDSSDNWFRGATEIHVFITFAVCLGLRGDGDDGDPEAVAFEERATQLTFLSFLVLVPGAFLVTVYLKLSRAIKLMERTELKTECSAAQRMLRGLADEQDVLTLSEMFKKIEAEIEVEKQKLELSDKDKRILGWVREHFELDPSMTETDTIQHAQTVLQLQLSTANDGGVWADVIKEIQEAIVQRTEVNDGIFLSHYQMYGPDVMDLKQTLIRAGMDGARIWYDKDNDPSEKSMREGVRDSKYCKYASNHSWVNPARNVLGYRLRDFFVYSLALPDGRRAGAAFLPQGDPLVLALQEGHCPALETGGQWLRWLLQPVLR